MEAVRKGFPALSSSSLGECPGLGGGLYFVDCDWCDGVALMAIKVECDVSKRSERSQVTEDGVKAGSARRIFQTLSPAQI